MIATASLLADGAPLLIAKTRPDRDLLDGASAAYADLLRIERANVDAGRFDARRRDGRGRHGMEPALNYGDRSPILQTLFGSALPTRTPKNTK